MRQGGAHALPRFFLRFFLRSSSLRGRVVAMWLDAVFSLLFLLLGILAAVVVVVWHLARFWDVLRRWWQGPPPPPEPDNAQKALSCIEKAIARGEHLKKRARRSKNADEKRRA